MPRKKQKSPQLNIFVSIGAGLNQIPLIVEAKKLGFHVIGVDENVAAPGFFKCDLKIQESIENYEEIHKILKELLVDGNICGIMTKSYGSAIKTTSFLTGKFKIPFLPFKTSNYFINKKKMKSIFMENKILTPHVLPYNINTKFDRISENDFPIVSKPNIGHAKIDVMLIKNTPELKNYLNKAVKSSKSFILEKYINGDEIISAGIIHEKKYYLADISDKKTSPPPYFVDLMHISPSKYFFLFDEIQKIGQAIADSFSISTSPLIMEFVVNEDNDLYLIEAVPEFGGEFIPDIVIPARTGYNFIGETIKAMTGKGFKPPRLKKSKISVVVKYITAKKGILASCNPEGPRKSRGIIFSRIFKEIGSNTTNPATNLDRIGVVVVKGKSVEETVGLAEKSVESFNIRIKK